MRETKPKPLWASRREPLSAFGEIIPDTVSGVMTYAWRSRTLEAHCKAAAPDLSPVQLWDAAENALVHRGTCADLQFRGWSWPDGCCAKIIAWCARENKTWLDGEAARARAAKAGMHVGERR